MNDAEKITITQVLDRAADARPDAPAMCVKRDGEWVTTTWREYREQARRAARSFMKLGLTPGMGVSIIGFNCPQWFVADIGAILAGGVPAGIYTTNSPEQCQYIASHSDSVVAVVEDAEQLAKFKKVRSQLPDLKGIVLMYGSDGDDGVYSWDEFLALADDVPESELDARIAAQSPDDTCTLIYTSGTTGNPKAVMITHDNLTWTAAVTVGEVEKYERKMGMEPAEITAISYLPLSHIAEQMVSLHGPMSAKGCTYFAESVEKLGDNLREVRPTLFLGVPRVWEKIQEKIVAAASKNTGLKKKIGAWARKQGLAGGYAEQDKRPKPMLFGLAEKLVFSKVRAQLGLDRSLLRVTSAAPISKDTLEFFLSLGVSIHEVYGMSECTGPATISMPDRYRTAKAGWCFPGGELKIAADGEVCMRGRHVFKGYFKHEEATREALDADGWLHSGDLGTIDEEGYLQITGRKKELIITAGGENIAPVAIEGLLQGIPVVSQAVVIGDSRKFLSALVTLDPAKVADAAREAGSEATTVSEAAACAKFNAYMMAKVDEINQQLARVQKVKKVTLVPTEFTIDGGELTPTMKLKRRVINEKYGPHIEAMYA